MKIELLYPEICNLYGEPQNAYYLARCCPDLEVAETRLGSRPLFLEEPVALVYLGTTTEQGLRLVTDALRPYRQEIAAKNFYRPRDEAVAKKYENEFPKLKLFTIDEEFGGWTKAQKDHFSNGGTFDQISKR